MLTLLGWPQKRRVCAPVTNIASSHCFLIGADLGKVRDTHIFVGNGRFTPIGDCVWEADHSVAACVLVFFSLSDSQTDSGSEISKFPLCDLYPSLKDFFCGTMLIPTTLSLSDLAQVLQRTLFTHDNQLRPHTPELLQIQLTT